MDWSPISKRKRKTMRPKVQAQTMFWFMAEGKEKVRKKKKQTPPTTAAATTVM